MVRASDFDSEDVGSSPSPAATAPSGWRLVPEEPTDVMVNKALAATAAWLEIPGSQLTVNREKMRVRYRAMIAAAPAPQSE